MNFLAKFLPYISELMSPILTKTDISWTLSQALKETFDKIKKVSEASVLRYYDHNKAFAIQCDASEKGLEATLRQDD